MSLGATIAAMRWFLRRWCEEYAFAYRWTLRHVAPFRWGAGALMLPETAAGDAVRALPLAALSGGVPKI